MRTEKNRHGITAFLGGIQATAPTKTAASENVLARADRALRGMDANRPRLLEWRGFVTMVYPTFDCGGDLHWCTQCPREVGEINDNIGHSISGGTMQKAISRAYLHMAQLANDRDGDISIPPGCDADDAGTLRTVFANRSAPVAA